MAVTIKDIARVCNVSYSTVSRVLNQKCVRKSEKSERILNVARAMGYKPNYIAVQLVKNQTNMIGLLIPDIANPHYPEITKSVEDSASAAGLQVFLCNSDWDVGREILYRDALLEKRVAGMIVMPVCDDSHLLFRGLETPVILLGSRTEVEDDNIHTVVMDNVRAAFCVTEYLISLGHRRLAYISRKVLNYTSADRIKGFGLAIDKYGIPPEDAPTVVSTSHRLEGGYQAAMELLSRENPPTAIVAFNDFLAFGAMQAAEEHGLAVGRDISIIGFDDILFSSLPKINLTTMTPSKAELGRRAVELILARQRGEHPNNVVLGANMIERGTCGRNFT